ncbi:MAG: winged helix-turn-helix transcriptional regulator [Betaproteobacteria bacterium]|nr:winged helix-turn-helix transcriptional regulator [Betaproteobacteria bacterium]
MPTNPVDLLFGTYRRQVLGLLLLRPGDGLHVREISRLTGVPAGSLHRELRALTEAGLLQREPAGNQVDRRGPGGGAGAVSADCRGSRQRRKPMTNVEEVARRAHSAEPTPRRA